MPNSNYAQVATLLAQGKLRWELDNISTILLTGATFNASHTKIDQVGGTNAGQAVIFGRTLADNGYALGQPVVFPTAQKDINYQVVIVQLIGPTDALVLAWIDENEEGDPITVERDGTLIVRPVQTDDIVPEDGVVLPPQVGVWMKL